MQQNRAEETVLFGSPLQPREGACTVWPATGQHAPARVPAHHRQPSTLLPCARCEPPPPPPPPGSRRHAPSPGGDGGRPATYRRRVASGLAPAAEPVLAGPFSNPKRHLHAIIVAAAIWVGCCIVMRNVQPFGSAERPFRPIALSSRPPPPTLQARPDQRATSATLTDALDKVYRKVGGWWW